MTGPVSPRKEFLAQMQESGLSKDQTSRLQAKQQAVTEAIANFPKEKRSKIGEKALAEGMSRAWDDAAKQFDLDSAFHKVAQIQQAAEIQSPEERFAFLKEAKFTDSEFDTLEAMSEENLTILTRGGDKAAELWQVSTSNTELIREFLDMGFSPEQASEKILSQFSQPERVVFKGIFGDKPSIANLLKCFGKAQVTEKMQQARSQILKEKNSEIIQAIQTDRASYTKEELASFDEVKEQLTDQDLPESVILSRSAPGYEALQTVQGRRAVRQMVKELEALGINRSDSRLDEIRDQLPDADGHFAKRMSSSELKSLDEKLVAIRMAIKTSGPVVSAKQNIVVIQLSLKQSGLSDATIKNNLPPAQQKTFEALSNPRANIPLQELEALETELKTIQALNQQILEMEKSLKGSEFINANQICSQLDKKDNDAVKSFSLAAIKSAVPLTRLANAMALVANGPQELIDARKQLLQSGLSEQEILDEVNKRPSTKPALTSSRFASADALNNIYYERELLKLGVAPGQLRAVLAKASQYDEQAIGAQLKPFFIQMRNAHEYLNAKSTQPGQKERRIKDFYANLNLSGSPSLEKAYIALGPEDFEKNWEALTSVEDVIYDLRKADFSDAAIAKAIWQQLPKEIQKQPIPTDLTTLRRSYPLDSLKAASAKADQSLNERLDKREAAALAKLKGSNEEELVAKMRQLLQANLNEWRSEDKTFQLPTTKLTLLQKRLQNHNIILYPNITTLDQLRQRLPRALFVDALEQASVKAAP